VLGPEQVEHHFADHRIVFHQKQPHLVTSIRLIRLL
jgi:hypothetical protein